MHLKFGFFFHSRNRVGLNLYTGLGFRVRRNSYSNIVNPRIVELGPEEGDFFGLAAYENIEGTHVAPNFALGFKLFYKLKN